MSAPVAVDVLAVMGAAIDLGGGNVNYNMIVARDAVEELMELLRISAGNVRSLGHAGALEALPHGPYGEWLRQLDAALARVGGAK